MVEKMNLGKERNGKKPSGKRDASTPLASARSRSHSTRSKETIIEVRSSKGKEGMSKEEGGYQQIKESRATSCEKKMKKDTSPNRGKQENNINAPRKIKERPDTDARTARRLLH